MKSTAGNVVLNICSRESTRRRLAACASLAGVLWTAQCVAQPMTPEVPDAVYVNGKVLTVDPAFSVQQAFAVAGDHFLAVGTSDSIRALAGPKTKIVDLGGHTVIPGIIDDHNHQYRAATLLLRGTDMSGVRSVPELLKRLRDAAAHAKPGETIYTNADWDPHALAEKRPPNLAELNEVGGGHPVIVQTTRGNAYINSAAMKGLNITRDTATFAGFPVVKDAAGEPTGWLTAPVGPALPQGLQQATGKLIPAATREEKMQLIMREQQLQNALGITSIREPWLSPDAMRVYQQLRREKKLTIRVSMGVTAFGSTNPEELQQTLDTWGVGTGFGDHWLSLDCVGELQVDGSVEASYLREPFTEPAGKQGSMLANATPENLLKLVSIVDAHDWRPATHVWGDKALDVTLDAYDAAEKEQGSIHDKRWTVEHALLIHPDQMDRLTRLGVLVSAQAQVYYEAPILLRSWGAERANKAEPIRELLDRNFLVGSGSDWPSLPNNPFVNFYFYVTRNTEKGPPLGVAEKVTREEALRMATSNNAYLTFEEKVKGSIEPGKLADFLVLSGDILTVPDEAIKTLHPLSTYVAGAKVYGASSQPF